MKIRYRIGVMPGTWQGAVDLSHLLWQVVDVCERSAIDSIWLSEQLSSAAPVLEPITSMAAIAARTRRLKFGSSVLAVPFRTPVVLAREIAMLDFLSGGRVLPAIGIGAEDQRAFHAAGVPMSERGKRTDEALQIMRACWTGEPVQYHGEFWQLDGIQVLPRPVQQPMPVWIGGNSEAAVRRTARFGDGWIPSFIEPEAFRSGIAAILDGAAAAGRSVPEDHFGVVMHFCLNAEPRVARALAMPFVPKRAGQSAIEATVAFGPPELVREQLERYVSAGGSKFILRPACPPERMIEQLEWLANEVIPDFHRR